MKLRIMKLWIMMDHDVMDHDVTDHEVTDHPPHLGEVIAIQGGVRVYMQACK